MLLMMFDTEESRDKLSYFYEKFRKKLLRVAAGYVHDQYLAEDLVEQAFIVADRYLDRLDENNLPASYYYLQKIVISQCKNYFCTRKPTDSLEEMVENGYEISEKKDHNPLTKMVYEEELEFVKIALEELPELDRAVVELFYLAEMKYKDIAELLGIQEGLVGVKLFRARRQMKKRIMRMIKKGVKR